ncbi:MAG: class I SAM-dependent methyltransferase [Isosphaeraceae bacterium]
MRYPEPASVGSLFLPKLLGTYERELQPLVEALCGRQYSEVVDVGCAEGYYAVGMALRIPTAKVFAFDINAEALRLCESMARLNGVSDRLVAGSFCDPAALKSLPLTRRALIICDCEGYETTLLCDDVVPLLVNHDLLIEVHDCIDPAISSILRQRFSNTHRVMAVQSVGDETMALTYGYEEILGYDLETRKMILAEGRWGVMEWFYLTPRSSARL